MTDIFLERTTELHLRIWREFDAMPGLKLTMEQACRLFGGPPAEVAFALQELEGSLLRQIGPYYVRADFGRFSA